jgi:hypothetical protein
MYSLSSVVPQKIQGEVPVPLMNLFLGKGSGGRRAITFRAIISKL